MTSDAYRLTWWLRSDLRELLPKDRSQYTWIARTGTNEVTISGFKQDMPFWEDRVRKADVRDYGK